MSRKSASTFAQIAKNVSVYFKHPAKVLQDRIVRCGCGDRTRPIAIPEWERVYLKEAEQRRLLHQARVLGWGKQKSAYFSRFISGQSDPLLTSWTCRRSRGTYNGQNGGHPCSVAI